MFLINRNNILFHWILGKANRWGVFIFYSALDGETAGRWVYPPAASVLKVGNVNGLLIQHFP